MTGTSSPITDAWLALSPDIRSRAEEIAGSNRPVTWPEVLLLVGTAIAGERERCALLRDALIWMRDRDDKNGSLPEAYRRKIDEVTNEPRADVSHSE